MFKSITAIFFLALASGPVVAQGAQEGGGSGRDPSTGVAAQHDKFPEGSLEPLHMNAVSDVPCQDGTADIFSCSNIDLLSFVPVAELAETASNANDIWGWTDSESGREYAVVGLSTGTSFVDITEPTSPVVLGRLPTRLFSNPWRDVKVYRDHAYIVSESADHGMQVFALRTLAEVTDSPATFTATATYEAEGLATTHNIAINEETGFAYLVGSNTCEGGLHMVDLSEPASPAFAGCFSGDGYVHDAHCVVYQGVDAEHVGREICFAANEDTVTIIDVTDKANAAVLSKASYPGFGYVHQAWATSDHMFLIQNDELDEINFGHPTTTYVWSLVDLDGPVLLGRYVAETISTDHNLYTHQGFVYQANYRAGVRVLDMAGIADGSLREVGFFDVDPDGDEGFDGAWSLYPYFSSGVVIASGVRQGLFVLKPRLP